MDIEMKERRFWLLPLQTQWMLIQIWLVRTKCQLFI
jgi:hypothetical protein